MSPPSKPPPNEQFKTGLQVRREVVGETYVSAALTAGSNEFSWPGQELFTEWCWGNVWTRPGLERKQRSLLSQFWSSLCVENSSWVMLISDVLVLYRSRNVVSRYS